MPRNLDPTMAAALATNAICPFFMAVLVFKSTIQYVWTGVGTLNYQNQNYIGVGSAAQIGTIQSGTDVQAYGTTITLSGIDPVMLGECMTDMVPGAQATL